MSGPDPNLACTRAGLLASLRRDGAATPTQLAALDEHLAACAACRSTSEVSARVDAAVGEHLRRRSAGTVPEGFVAAVVAAAVAQRAQAIAENRFLRRAAAAAVFVAAVAGGAMLTARTPVDFRGLDSRVSADIRPADASVASARDAARTVVIRPRYEGR